MSIVSELAAIPQGRNNIRHAVDTYRQSMDRLQQDVSKALQGRKVTYHFGEHCFKSSEYAHLPVESVRVQWEKDHLLYSVAKLVDDLFSDLNFIKTEEKKSELALSLRTKQLKVVERSAVLNLQKLQQAKSNMDRYLSELLDKATAFERADAFESLSRSFPIPGSDAGETESLFRSVPVRPTYLSVNGESAGSFLSDPERAVAGEDSQEASDKILEERGSSGKNLFVRFFISLRKVILVAFNWFVDQFV